jgi:hypothetical protein
MRIPASDIDASLHPICHRSELNDRIIIGRAIQCHVRLIGVGSGHHVGRRFIDGGVVQELPCRAVEHRQLTVEPLREDLQSKHTYLPKGIPGYRMSWKKDVG